MRICLVDDGLDMTSSITFNFDDAIRARKLVSVVFWVKPSPPHYHRLVFVGKKTVPNEMFCQLSVLKENLASKVHTDQKIAFYSPFRNILRHI